MVCCRVKGGPLDLALGMGLRVWFSCRKRLRAENNKNRQERVVGWGEGVV